MKNLKQILTSAALAGGVVAASISNSNPSLANDKCNFNFSLSQKSDYRGDSGMDAIKGPVTEGVAGLSCGNLDAFIFGAHNNNSGRINEVDVGVGYSFSKGNFSGRVGIARWMYEEDGGKNDVAELSLRYGGLPVDIELGITKILDDKGTQVTGRVSKTFELGKMKDIDFTLTPSLKATYLDNYFGLSGHSNDIFGISLGIMKDNVGADVFADYHVGHRGLENDTKVGITLKYNF